MKELAQILKEQITNFSIIYRLSSYEDRATYQSYYLGLLWQVLNPAIQIGIYYIVFGLGLNGNTQINGTPFIVWMLVGIVQWFFISSSMLGTSNSIVKQIVMVSKMKFPVSILPTVNIVSNLMTYIPMMLITVLVLFLYGITPNIYWIQFLYYFLAMIIFLVSCGILFATLTILVRDFHILLQSVIRLMLYVSGAIWNIESRNLPDWMIGLLKLNPVYYLINGFRESLLYEKWFWENGNYTLLFWSITLLIFMLGSHLHLKFGAKFVDFV